MKYLLLLTTWTLWGLWAVSVKKSGDMLGLRWTYVTEAALYAFTLPVDIYLISKIDWHQPRPSTQLFLWVIALTVAGQAGQLLTVYVAPQFTGNTITMVSSTYPVAAMLIFWFLGERPTPLQLIGTVLAICGTVLVCIGER